MPRKRFITEQVITKLRQAEVELGRVRHEAGDLALDLLPGDRVRRQPEGHVTPLNQRSIVRRPVSDTEFRLVLRMHSRFHIEIMHCRLSYAVAYHDGQGRDEHSFPRTNAAVSGPCHPRGRHCWPSLSRHEVTEIPASCTTSLGWSHSG